MFLDEALQRDLDFQVSELPLALETPGRLPEAEVVISSGDETLCAPAFGALVDAVHKARLLRLRAGKAHLGAAFHALRVFVALWHRPPMRGLARLAS